MEKTIIYLIIFNIYRNIFAVKAVSSSSNHNNIFPSLSSSTSSRHQYLRNLSEADNEGSTENSIITFILFLVQVAVIYLVLRACVLRCRGMHQRNRSHHARERSDAMDTINMIHSQRIASRIRESLDEAKMKQVVSMILDCHTVPYSKRHTLPAFNNNNIKSTENEPHALETHGEDSKVGSLTRTEAEIPDAEQCTCAICLDDYEDSDMVVAKGCQHLFHRECLNNWFHLKGYNCPYCRETMITEEEIQQHL